ncbi:MAG: uroporphyrinogen-III synthase [Planctomycetota bacterium]
MVSRRPENQRGQVHCLALTTSTPGPKQVPAPLRRASHQGYPRVRQRQRQALAPPLRHSSPAGVCGVRSTPSGPLATTSPGRCVSGSWAFATSSGSAVDWLVAGWARPEKQDLTELFSNGGVQWITFTSSSTVRNLLEVVPPEQLRSTSARFASIGPSTSRTLTDAGLPPSVEAEVPAVPGLVEAILQAP